jgi:hypothetical protein
MAMARRANHIRRSCKSKRSQSLLPDGSQFQRRPKMRGYWRSYAHWCAITRLVCLKGLALVQGMGIDSMHRHLSKPPRTPLPHAHFLSPRAESDHQILPDVVLQPRNEHVRMWYRRPALRTAMDCCVHRRTSGSDGVSPRPAGETGRYQDKEGTKQVQGTSMVDRILYCIMVARHGTQAQYCRMDELEILTVDSTLCTIRNSG